MFRVQNQFATRRLLGFKPKQGPAAQRSTSAVPWRAPVEIERFEWRKALIKPVIFAVGVTVVSLAGSALWADYNRRRGPRRITIRLRPTSDDAPLLQQAGDFCYNAMQRARVAWHSCSASTQTLTCLALPNAAVFALWQLPNERVRNFMALHFTHSAWTGRSLPLLLCTFSHMTVAHFLFNMIGLVTFGQNLHKQLGRERFLGLYFASAAMSSLGSHIFNVARHVRIPSLGASGAVLGLVSASTYLNPNSQLALIFLPFWSFSAISMLPCLVAFDVVGLTILRGRLGFDHMAHLCGTGFGWSYMMWNYPNRNPLRGKLPGLSK